MNKKFLINQIIVISYNPLLRVWIPLMARCTWYNIMW